MEFPTRVAVTGGLCSLMSCRSCSVWGALWDEQRTKSCGNCTTVTSNSHLLLESDMKYSQMVLSWWQTGAASVSVELLLGEWGLCGPSLCQLKLGWMPGCVQGAGLESRGQQEYYKVAYKAAYSCQHYWCHVKCGVCMCGKAVFSLAHSSHTSGKNNSYTPMVSTAPTQQAEGSSEHKVQHRKGASAVCHAGTALLGGWGKAVCFPHGTAWMP